MICKDNKTLSELAEANGQNNPVQLVTIHVVVCANEIFQLAKGLCEKSRPDIHAAPLDQYT